MNQKGGRWTIEMKRGRLSVSPPHVYLELYLSNRTYLHRYYVGRHLLLDLHSLKLSLAAFDTECHNPLH